MSNSKVFTDEDGNKYEALFTAAANNKNWIAIKPLKEDKKMKCTLKFEFWSEMSNESISEDYKFTPTQFKAVSEAIEALMEYIQDPVIKWTDTVADIAYEAWKVIGKAKKDSNE